MSQKSVKMKMYLNKMISRLEKFLFSSKKRKIIVATVALALVISILHYLTFEQPTVLWTFLHKELTKLYFLPVLLAAFWGGRRSALLLSLIVSVFYLPHAIRSWSFEQSVLLENLSEILLLWIVGVVAGTLSDRLRSSEAEKTRLATIQEVSKILEAINQELLTDYEACQGLARALEKNVSTSEGNSFSAQILLNKLEHLGSHLQHLQNLAMPQPLIKRKYNIIHLLKKSLESTIPKKDDTQVELHTPDKISPLKMDVKRMEFAFLNILQMLMNGTQNGKRMDIRILDKPGKVAISFNLFQENDEMKWEKWNHLDLFADPQKGYAFSLALAVVRSHGGEMDFIQKKEDRREICLTLPKN